MRAASSRWPCSSRVGLAARSHHLRLDDENRPVRVGGVRYTIKDGIYDTRQLLADVERIVEEAKAREGELVAP